MGSSRNTDFLFDPEPASPRDRFASLGFGMPVTSYGLSQQMTGLGDPRIKAFEEDLAQMGSGEAQNLRNEIVNREYGGGMSKAELQDFDTLISRLEASKMKQAGQANRARQRDTFAGGLSSMMRNF